MTAPIWGPVKQIPGLEKIKNLTDKLFREVIKNEYNNTNDDNNDIVYKDSETNTLNK